MTQPVEINHIQVRVLDGVPLCNHCLVPMVEIDPGIWQCGLSVALFGELTELRLVLGSVTTPAQPAANDPGTRP